jgi:hypothetical protein
MQQIPIDLKSRIRSADDRPTELGLATVTKLSAIVPLYIAMIAGTGGVYANTNLSYAASIYDNRMIEIRGHQAKREQLMSVAQQVSTIRDALGLKMSELAQFFDVTRPTAYAWLNGSDPKPEVRVRIHRLSRVVDELRSAGIERIDRYARLPLNNGQSLIDVLRSGADTQASVAAVKRTALKASDASLVERGIGPHSRKKIVRLDEISAPINV